MKYRDLNKFGGALFQRLLKNVSSITFVSYCFLHYPAIKDVLSFEETAEINDPNENDEFTAG